MKSVIDNENTIIIKNSRFICLIYQIDDVSKVDNYLENAKKKYKDATHYCYAYIIGNNSKCSDDGEPSGTAGIPMLQVLKKNNLNNVLCIVIRYFNSKGDKTFDVLFNLIVNNKLVYCLCLFFIFSFSFSKFVYNYSKEYVDNKLYPITTKIILSNLSNTTP